MIKYNSQDSRLNVEGVDAGRPSRHESLYDDFSEHGTSHREGDTLALRAAGTHARKLREEITQIREHVITSRLDLREQRAEMRQQHGLVRVLERQFLRCLQHGEAVNDHDAMGRLHTELCAALDQLGPMEEDYDEKEDKLDTLEFDLEAKERRFYRQYAQSDASGSLESPSTQRSSISMPPQEVEVSLAHRPDFLSPQYQYYSRVGDAKIVRERLMELEAQRDHFLEIERDRDALSIPLYQENIDFLANYDSAYAEHVEELEKIDNDIYNLGLQAGFFKPNDVTFTAATPAPAIEDFSDFSAERQPRSPFTDPEQTRRSSSPTPESPRRKSEADVQKMPKDQQSSRERINQWILERLKNTRLEKARHRAILNDPELAPEVWWSLVLEFWQQDRAAISSAISSRNASGAPTSERPQALQGSMDLASDNVPNVAPATPEEAYAGANQRYAPISPLPFARDHAGEIFDQLSYLDLAAQCSSTTKKAREKWDFILGC
ncbi:MAG: hypothetical protein LQ341_002827 [Variospora aurantia]|nr:MAG: hypothetical protein LQ341_002827 [Variospora aurantia]